MFKYRADKCPVAVRLNDEDHGGVKTTRRIAESEKIKLEKKLEKGQGENLHIIPTEVF